MKIECKLLREGGTTIELDGIEYHFAPQADGAHVAEVLDERHQDKLLTISEGYRLYRGKAAIEAPPAPVKEIVTLLGSSVHPATFEIHGKTWQLGDVVALAAASFDPAEWNDLSDDARADLIDEQLDKLQADTNGDGAVDGDEELAALREQYKAKFGSYPHARTKADTIRDKLAE